MYKNKIIINLSIILYFMQKISLLKNKNAKNINVSIFKFKAKLPRIYVIGINRIK